MQNPKLTGSSIAFLLTPFRQSLYEALAVRLKQEHGCSLHAYFATEMEASRYSETSPPDLWSSINAWDKLTGSITKAGVSLDKEIERAQEFEALLGETINRMTFSNRQLGRGYSPGGACYPRAQIYEEAGYANFLHAYNTQLSFWQREFEEKSISLIIDGDVLVAALARSMGVQFRRIIGARYKNNWFWSVDEYQTNPDLVLPDSVEGEESAEITQAYATSSLRVSKHARKASLFYSLKTSIRSAINYAYWRLIGADRYKNLTFWGLVLSPYRERSRFWDAMRLSDTTLDEVRDRRFVYFPMHKEPETSFTTRSPNVTDQLAVIIALSRDLPAGVQLVVKENIISTGQRPKGYLKQIKDLKNVVLIDPYASSVELIKNSLGVATITGTAGMEAAIMGKPVIVFAEKAPYAILDHVRVVSGVGDVRQDLAWLIAARTEEQRDEAKRNGARYEAAVRNASFDMEDYGAKIVGTKGFQQVKKSVVDKSFDALVRSMAPRA